MALWLLFGSSLQLTDLLTLYADTIYETSPDVYLASGNVSLNNILYFTADVTADMALHHLTGSCKIYVPDVPFAGTVWLYDGGFDVSFSDNILSGFDLLNSILEMSGFDVNIEQMAVLDDGVQIWGTLCLPEILGSQVEVDNVLVSQSQGLGFAGTLYLPEIDMEGYKFEDGYITYDQINDIFGGGGKVKTAILGIGAGLQFVHGDLDSIYLEITPSNPIPIGATGIYLVEGGGGLSNLATGPVKAQVCATLSGGPSVGGYELIGCEGCAEVQAPDRFALKGNLYLIDESWFPISYGELRYSGGGLKIYGTVNLAEILKGELQCSWQEAHVTGSVRGGLYIPSSGLPWWLSWLGGQCVGGVNGDFDNERIRGMIYVPLDNLWGGSNDISLAFQLVFTPDLHFYLGTDYDHLLEIDRKSKGNDTIWIPEGYRALMFFAGDTIDSQFVYFKLIDPLGIVHDTSNTPTFHEGGVSFYLIDMPIPGPWVIQAPSGKLIQVTGQKPQDASYVTQVSKGYLEFYSTKYGVARIYADDDPRGYNGTFLDSIPVVRGLNSYYFDQSRLPPGKYWFHIVLADTLGAPIQTYSQPIEIENPLAPPPPQTLYGVPQDSVIRLYWQPPSDSSGIWGYVVYCTDRPEIRSAIKVYTVDRDTQLVIRDLQPGHAYKIWIRSFDTTGLLSQASDTILVNLISYTRNNPPYIYTYLPPTRAYADSIYSFSVRAIDMDNDPISYQLIVHPIGMTMDSSGNISWTPHFSQVGVHWVWVEAEDPHGAKDTLRWKVQVLKASDDKPKMFIDKALYEGFEQGIVLAHDRGYDLDSAAFDSIQIHIWSQSDPTGITIYPRELSPSMATFMGDFSFTTGASGPHVIHVEDGDTVYIQMLSSEGDTLIRKAVWHKEAAVAERTTPSDGRLRVKISPTLVSGNKVYLNLTLPTSSRVRVSLYNAAGCRVASLWEGVLQAGRHALPLRVSPARGVYFLVVEVDGKRVAMEKLVFNSTRR